MRYILNDSGFIEAVSFNNVMTCNNKSCTEYTGTVPTGYESLAEWSENANINAYKIVNGNLTYDSEEDARLQSLWASQETSSVNDAEILNAKSDSTTDAYSANYLNKKIEVVNVTQAGTNLNDYVEAGTYFFFSLNVTPTNIPTGLYNGWLVVLEGTEGTIKQIWFSYNTPEVHFKTYIRTKFYSGEWTEWQRLMVEDDIYYKDGDTFTDIGYIACIGHLTSSQKSIYFTLPVEKRLDNVDTITINSISANIRHTDGGYVVQGDLTSLGTVSASKSTNNLLRVRFDLTGATTFTNNTPLAVDITDISITFNK